MTTEIPTLRVDESAPVSLRRWLLGLVLVGAALAALLAKDAALDSLLWRSTRWFMGSQDAYVWAKEKLDPQVHPTAPFYKICEPPLHGKLYKRTENFWRLFRDLGEPHMTFLLLVIVWVYDRRRAWRAPLILLAATALPGVLSAVIRYTGGRLRPNGELAPGISNEGQNIWEFCRGMSVAGKFPFLRVDAGDVSFPSGHATLAFATAAALAYLSPRGRWLFVILAAFCALARVVMQAHFYSDVLAGAALGYGGGYLLARLTARWLAQVAPPAAR